MLSASETNRTPAQQAARRQVDDARRDAARMLHAYEHCLSYITGRNRAVSPGLAPVREASVPARDRAVPVRDPTSRRATSRRAWARRPLTWF
jgi:hypothetical protein